jgi:hypothetical protein
MTQPPRRIISTALGAIAHYAHAVYESCTRDCRAAAVVLVIGLILLAVL